MSKKTTVVKFPVDILKYLKKEYPQSSNPERVRRLYEQHLEMKELKVKMGSLGSVIYGKKNWKKRFG